MGSLTPHKISFICFLDLFAASLIVPLVNNYLRTQVLLSNFTIGAIASTFSLLQIISAPTVGYLSDLYGRKTILLTCLFTCIVSYLLLGLYKSVYVIFFVRILLGLFKHTQVLCKAYISDICVDSTKAFSQLMMVTFLGFFIGPAIGGHVIHYENGFFYICCMTSALFVVNFVYTYWVVTDVKKYPTRTSLSPNGLESSDVNPLLQEEIDMDMGNDRPRDIKEERHVEKDSRARVSLSQSSFLTYCRETFNIDWSAYWGIFLIKFLYALAMSLFYSNYISVLTHNFHANSQVTGYTVSFQGLVGSFSNVLIHIDSRNSYSSLYYSFILLTVSILALYVSVNLYLFVLLLVSCKKFKEGEEKPKWAKKDLSFYNDADLERLFDHNISGIYNSLTSIAKVITPLLGGIISDWVQDNYKVTFLVAFLFGAVGVVTTRVVMMKSRRIQREMKRV
ncbi:major facilitator superfamily domain-containing protein 9-like [Diaphorina citri]|uniref:Major facilitator superfamily domain-containing protein 9-like n=1 Tax=Diaphorina citri TaxID=121845 RepID=A0A3Q0ILX5_DIACI|nr:major facilitator superfamily domain-containing protein 9-like [Diaphorina citri]